MSIISYKQTARSAVSEANADRIGRKRRLEAAGSERKRPGFTMEATESHYQNMLRLNIHLKKKPPSYKIRYASK